ncbi:MAG: LCP family protein [Candidatus Levybacteria bacterium]|nr:LCP family protein [Candidatus Levybacteria bacterium]
MVKETKFQKKKILLIAGVMLLILIGVFKNQLSSLLSIFYGVTIDRAINLTVKEKESFNIALLGIGGARHDGPDLSDTIILANINVKQNKVRMFSIPRDLWVPGDKDKINAIYANAKKEGNGISSVEAVLEMITGQKIDYVLVLDFDGFIKLVDHLEGIDINVAQTLDDYHYPIEGLEEDSCEKSEEDIKTFTATASAEMELWDYFPCRYKHLHVDKGLNHMDGQQALEFVRSRHGVGAEGSDFARSRRQQLVISASKDKAFSLGVILNPVKLVGVYNILKENIDTNINIDKVDDFIKLANKLKNGEVKNYVFDEGNSIERYGLLEHPGISEEYKLKWVLIPRRGNGNFSEIKEYVSCAIEGKDCIIGESGIITPAPTSGETR